MLQPCTWFSYCLFRENSIASRRGWSTGLDQQSELHRDWSIHMTWSVTGKSARGSHIVHCHELSRAAASLPAFSKWHAKWEAADGSQNGGLRRVNASTQIDSDTDNWDLTVPLAVAVHARQRRREWRGMAMGRRCHFHSFPTRGMHIGSRKQI